MPCLGHRIKSEFCSDVISLVVPNREGKVQEVRTRMHLSNMPKPIRISGEISITERLSDSFVLYETSRCQWVQSRLVNISYDWIRLLESGLLVFI